MTLVSWKTLMCFSTTEKAASEIWGCLLNLKQECLKNKKGKIYIEISYWNAT